jgi:hypothetical protein
MKAIDEKKPFDLTFSFRDRAVMGQFLKEVSRGPALEGNILRSRMTPFGGWATVALSGSPSAIQPFLRTWKNSLVTKAQSA